MKLSRLAVFAFIFLVGMSPAIAQESIRLQFEVAKDGSTLAAMIAWSAVRVADDWIMVGIISAGSEPAG